MRLGVASYCLPIIAIAPILSIRFHGQTPNIILAALSVFFTTLDRHARRSAQRRQDRARRGPRVRRRRGSSKLTKVRLRAALPSLFAALRIAAPAAVLGAIIGEYFGAERGLGVAMIASETGLEIARTWGLAIVAAALAGVAYGITALVGRLLTPWAPERRARMTATDILDPVGAADARADGARGAPGRQPRWLVRPQAAVAGRSRSRSCSARGSCS